MIPTLISSSVRFNFHPFRRQEGMAGLSPFGFSASFRISSMVLSPLGISSMPGSTTFSVNEHQPESLRSVGITRLQRYYALIRLPKRPSTRLCVPAKRSDATGLMPPTCPPFGISQVSDFTFDTRCSQPPRIARQLRLPVASLPMIDFAISGRLVAIKMCHEAESPCYRKHGLTLRRLMSLPERIPPTPITPRKRRRTTCQTGNLHDNLLVLTVFK